MKKGWISIHRSLADHWLWSDEKFTKGQAWLDLLLHANHKENKALIKGQLINVGRGQQLRSQVTLAKIWRWDRKTVGRFLKLLENESMIVQTGTHLTTIITICNYSDFQDADKNNPQLKGHLEGQAVPSTRDTDNNDNNGNNTKKKSKRFIPPKPEEVQAYLDEKGITQFTGEKFVAHYEATGWMRGTTKIKSWKACVTTWSKKNDTHQKPGNTGSNGKGAAGGMLDDLLE